MARARGRLGRRMLAALLAVSLVPLLLAALLTWWRSAALLDGFVTETVAKTAKAYASDLDLFLERQRQRLRDIATARTDLAAVLRTVPPGEAHLDALLVVDDQGRLVAQSREAVDTWVVEACRVLVDDPDQAMTHAGRGHDHEVVVGVKRAGGVLCGQVNFTLHQDMLSERASGALGGTAFIVDREGTVVCHAFERDEPNRGRGDQLGISASQVAAMGRPWAGSAQSGQREVLAAFAPAATLPWGVWVEVSEDVAAAPLRSWLAQTLGVAGLLALAAVGAAVWVVHRLVDPLEDVVKQARRITSGELGGRVPVRGNDEIAELAREFNRMSEALKSSYDELDARVQDRTRELAGARELSDLLLDTMRERILVMDSEQRIVRANRAAVDAYGAQVLGGACHEVHRRTGTEAADCPAREALERGEPTSEERTYTHGGRTEILAVDTYPLASSEAAVVEIARDVTAARRMQARLAHQEKMASLGTLAAGLAHEIGNPLASLSSELEMLERLWDPEDARRSLPVLRDLVRRMAKLLRELVDLGRPSSDEAARFAPRDVMEEVARLIRHDPRSHGIEVSVAVDQDAGTLCTSRDRLSQVLVNLGLNALDALAGHGRVEFRAGPAPTGDGVQLTVGDDGPGVPVEAREHVFDPFYTTKGPGHGTGLGLFVSERIVEGLGGRLELDRAAGPGARFVVTLPSCGCGACDAAGEVSGG